MFNLIESIVSVATNATKVVVAPVEITLNLVNAALEPVVDAAKELNKDVRSISK
jgi:hypothetical protein